MNMNFKFSLAIKMLYIFISDIPHKQYILSVVTQISDNFILVFWFSIISEI